MATKKKTKKSSLPELAEPKFDPQFVMSTLNSLIVNFNTLFQRVGNLESHLTATASSMTQLNQTVTKNMEEIRQAFTEAQASVAELLAKQVQRNQTEVETEEGQVN